MHLLNCTPHPVRFYDSTGSHVLWELRPEAQTVRIATAPQAPAGALEVGWDIGEFVPSGKTRAFSGDLFGVDHPGRVVVIPLVAAPDFAAGAVTGLPEWARAPHDDGFPYALIVGQLGAEAVGRAWPWPVFATDTGPESAVRDGKGNILGVRRLILVSRGGLVKR